MLDLEPSRWMRAGLQWLIATYPEAVFNLYPPYVGAGIRVESIRDDFRRVEVSMPLRWYNQNFVGTHFGGSLYAMCDPFLMVMLIQNLGDDYVVWDKAADIRFRKPGRGTVRATFELMPERIEEIRRRADRGETIEPEFLIQIHDDAGDVVAEVDKLLYVRKKQ